MESTSEDRILAAVSHLGIFLNLLGIVLALIIYLLKQEQSKFIAHHAKQAVGFQLVVVIAGAVAGFSGFGVALGSLFFGPGPGVVGIVGVAVFFWLTIVLVAICAIVGAVRALMGKDFQYPLVGELIDRIV
ncbi:MAG: DUF4870 domain-containing protein [Bacillota bacterium]